MGGASENQMNVGYVTFREATSTSLWDQTLDEEDPSLSSLLFLITRESKLSYVDHSTTLEKI